MYGIKDKSTGEIVSTTDQEQSKFGGPWSDPDLFEFVPNYVKPKTVSEVSGNITSEADNRVDILLVDQRKSDRVAAFVLRMNDKRLNGETLTPAQQNKLTTLRQWYQYFEDVRAVEDTEKASLSGMTQEQLNNYDPVAAPAWPSPPQ